MIKVLCNLIVIRMLLIYGIIIVQKLTWGDKIMKRLKKMMFLCMAGTLLFIGSPHRVVLAVEPIKLVVNGNEIGRASCRERV